MEKKKPTKAEIERRIKNALVFVPKDKDYNCVYFVDKGLKLEVTQDNTVISTTFHKHVFDNVTSSGISKPYIYVKRFIELAQENDCIVRDENGVDQYSYQKLMHTLKNKENNPEQYAVAFFCDLWLFNLFMPLYSIDNNAASSLIVYLDYVCNVAKNSIILEEHVEDMTNKQFIEEFITMVKDLTEELVEEVVFKKKTDDELMQESIEALQQDEFEKAIKE